MIKTAGLLATCLLMAACSEPPKPQIPALTPSVAQEILHNETKAQNWITHAQRQDPSCEYELAFPDQASQPTALDFSHIVKCGGRTAPRELDASVSFEFDKNAQHWVITRFSD